MEFADQYQHWIEMRLNPEKFQLAERKLKPGYLRTLNLSFIHFLRFLRFKAQQKRPDYIQFDLQGLEVTLYHGCEYTDPA